MPSHEINFYQIIGRNSNKIIEFNCFFGKIIAKEENSKLNELEPTEGSQTFVLQKENALILCGGR